MTPAERKFDVELLQSARRLLRPLERNSARMHTTFSMVVERLDYLSRNAPIDDPPSDPDAPELQRPASPDQTAA